MAPAVSLCLLVAALFLASASCSLPGRLTLSSNASVPCVQDWADVLARKYPSWEWIIDATGKSLWDLGKYDQCRDLGHKVAKYCYVQYPMGVGGFGVPGALGVCAPASCTDADLEFALDDALDWAFGNSSSIKDQSFVHCLPHEGPDFDTSAIVAIIIVGFVASFAIAGTSFDYITSQPPVAVDDIEPLLGSINDDKLGRRIPSDGPRETKLGQLFLSFSLKWNVDRLHQPHPDKKTAVLNGLRVFSMFWVILGHSFLYGRFNLNHPIGYQNLAHVFFVEAKKWTFQVVFGAELAVDTFFYLSGFLVTWGALEMLYRTRKLNLLLYYVHRYWRLTPIYAFCIMIFSCLMKYMADGPAWFMFEAGCSTKWWTNLLYITDFYPTQYADLCYGWGWYLSIDFHFYVFTPIFIFAYYFSRPIGWTLASLALFGCWISNAVVTYRYDLSYDPISANFNTYANDIYNKPWTRMGPYVIGMMFAFFLQHRKQKQDDAPVRIPTPLLWVCYAIVSQLLFWPVYGTHYLFDSTDRNGGFTKLGNIFYIAFARSGWALGIGMLSTLCYWGYGGIVRWILERDMWTPMARLTYLAYLVHPMILIPIYGGARVYHVYSEFELASKFAGNVSLAYCAAFALWLLVEKPTMNVEKFLLPSHGASKKKAAENGLADR